MTGNEKKKDTEQKILDAALKIFARKGYDAATTRAIAEESGFTEMTLFRKFETKKNLFDQVMNRGNLQIERDAAQLFESRENKNKKEFLKSFIKSLDDFVLRNFEYFHLTIIEDSSTVKPNVRITIDYISQYFKDQFPNKELDFTAFGYSMSTFVYALNIDRYYGRTASFDDYNESLENLVNILVCMLENN